jgi:hypothetical protein
VSSVAAAAEEPDDFDIESVIANWTPAAKEKALREFMALTSVNRRAWYCDRGRICDGKPHGQYSYKHARGDQYPPPGSDWLIWAVFSGRGCVAPATRVFNPSTGEHVPIADIPTGFPTDVLAMDGVYQTEGGPFRKGFDELWRVQLVDGNQITVTAEHKFLTRHGWVPLLELDPGDLIASGGPSAQYSEEPFWTHGPHSGVKTANLHNNHYRPDFEQFSGLDKRGFFSVPRWSEISSITYSHHGEYWDLTVPGPNHYTAEGIWNHNSGKTRTGAEWVRKISERTGRIGMVGRRGVDVRATMVEGESGLIFACENAGIGFDWQPSKREFTFPNGGKVFGYSGEEPDSLRGPQHGALWLDEPAHMPLIEDVWDNAALGLRLPGLPGGAKALVTTTPLATTWIKNLTKDPAAKIVRVSTYANLENLDPAFRSRVLRRYEGTRLGRQELHGEVLEDVEGAMWSGEMFSVSDLEAGDCERIVVGIDPAGTNNRRSDETGIIAVGTKGDEFIVLADGTGKYSPNGWAQKTIDIYRLMLSSPRRTTAVTWSRARSTTHSSGRRRPLESSSPRQRGRNSSVRSRSSASTNRSVCTTSVVSSFWNRRWSSGFRVLGILRTGSTPWCGR